MQSLHSADPRGCAPLPPDGRGPPRPQGKSSPTITKRAEDAEFYFGNVLILLPEILYFVLVDFCAHSVICILRSYKSTIFLRQM